MIQSLLISICFAHKVFLLCFRNILSTRNLMVLKPAEMGPQFLICFFADDSLIFCQANEDECINLLEILRDYENASGQKVNFQKSAIIFGKGLNAERKTTIAQLIGIQKIGGFGRYLGLPEMIKRNKNDVFSFIKQRVMQKVECWY